LSFVKRSRIVSIRVTQNEYQTLERISRGHGANSVSEFLRQLIMDSEPVASAAKAGTREFTEELDELKRKVDRLSQLVKQRVKKQSARDAIAEEKGLQIGMPHHEPLTDL
jgi:tetrahydromethanopterin S-methyltransferase subunit G